MAIKWHALLFLLATVAALWEFNGVRQAGFVYEDSLWTGGYFIHNQQLPTPLEVLTNSRLLMPLTWDLQFRHSSSASLFHIVNLVLHLIVSILVAILAFRIGLSPFGVWIAFTVFLLNPVQMESAVYLSGRTELLAAIGVLTACILLCGKINWWSIPLALLAAWFGWMGKESAITVFALVPLVRRKWAVAIMAILVIVTIVFTRATEMNLIAGSPLEGYKWAFTQLVAAWRILATSMTLIGGTIYFDYWDLPTSIQIISVTLLLLIMGICYKLWRTRPILAMGALWITIVVAPRLVVYTPGSELNEHQFYLAMVGFSLAVASLIETSGYMQRNSVSVSKEYNLG